MDYLAETIALSIDSIIFGVCLRQYFHCRNAMKAVKNAEIHDVNENLRDLVNSSPNKRINYIAVKGIVKPVGKVVASFNNPIITGVIQRLTVKEHVIARTTAGFWQEQERTIQNVYNSVPFILQSGNQKIEVADALSAEILDLDVISDEFKPSASSFGDHIWGFFTGVRQKGLQTTEEMLQTGVTVTGIGELTQSAEKPDCLTLQPPISGTPFYLTTMSVRSLLRKLDERRITYRWFCIVFGAIGIVVGGILIRRVWKNREEQRLAEEIRQRLAESRKERRQRVRNNELREDQLCVVCKENPRELILLPCGHVCLCEDCSDGIELYCPLCRGFIEQKAAAYIA